MTDTTAIVVACIASLPPTVVGLVGLRIGSSIHVLVNSKMTHALDEITRLQRIIDKQHPR